MKKLNDYKDEKYRYITTLESEYYPDYLAQAKLFYEPILLRFGELLKSAKNSTDLFLAINQEPPSFRIQLLRIFRKYVSPDTSVEMLKVKNKANEIIEHFGNKFRNIAEVVQQFNSRPQDDEVLIAILHEYQDRGKKGYDLTGKFFVWFEEKFSASRIAIVTEEHNNEVEILPHNQENTALKLSGPIGAGKDILLDSILEDFPKKTPADFVIWDNKDNPLVIGFARYDSDRGGSQEDDRIKGNSDNITDILSYAKAKNINLKVILLNDGPGLLLGSMWNDYSALEERGAGKVMVLTLKMLEERLNYEWIVS